MAVESAEPPSEDQRVGPMNALGCLLKVFHDPHQEQIFLEQFSVASKKQRSEFLSYGSQEKQQIKLKRDS